MNTTQNSHIEVEPTPNPNALKFVCDTVIRTEGKVSFKDPMECHDIPLARALFELRGVDQIHFFQNVVTISKFSFEPWDELESKILKTLEVELPKHDPNFSLFDPELERRKNLSPALIDIEAILDKRIRPGLQGDGGDLVCLSYEDNVLLIKYQGACGTCPSSTAGTLEAIRQILKDEYSEDIEVYIAPS
jgi:Fe-S cluster biogenesis protein NfuA